MKRSRNRSYCLIDEFHFLLQMDVAKHHVQLTIEKKVKKPHWAEIRWLTDAWWCANYIWFVAVFHHSIQRADQSMLKRTCYGTVWFKAHRNQLFLWWPPLIRESSFNIITWTLCAMIYRRFWNEDVVSSK